MKKEFAEKITNQKCFKKIKESTEKCFSVGTFGERNEERTRERLKKNDKDCIFHYFVCSYR